MLKNMSKSLIFLFSILTLGFILGVYLEHDHILRILVAVPYTMLVLIVNIYVSVKSKVKQCVLSIVLSVAINFILVFICLFVVSTAGTPAWNFGGLRRLLLIFIIAYIVIICTFHVVCAPERCSKPVK
jgi:predicted neutral ceramidase superfamily lipid hydrolase